MNKTLIAAAVSAAVAAPVASADITVYGRINNAIDLNDLSANGEGSTDISTVASRFGLKGSTDLGNGLTVHGQYEVDTVSDRESSGKDGSGPGDVRIATAGVSGSFGRLDVGNQWSAYNKAVGALISPTFTLGYYLYADVGRGLFRASNTIQYSNSWGPVGAVLDIRLNDANEGADVAESVNGNGWGLGVTYQVTPSITLTAAYDIEDGADRIKPNNRWDRTVTGTYNPGNAALRGATDVRVQGADGVYTYKTFVAVTTVNQGGGDQTLAEVGTTAVVATSPETTVIDPNKGSFTNPVMAKQIKDESPEATRTGVAGRWSIGAGYWLNAGWQNYQLDGDPGDPDDSVDVDTLFVYGGGPIGQKTTWLLGYSQADNGKEAVAAVAGVGSTTTASRVRGSLASEATDDANQLVWGLYHNVGGGLRFYYEAVSQEFDVSDNTKDRDGERHLLGIRVDF